MHGISFVDFCRMPTCMRRKLKEFPYCGRGFRMGWRGVSLIIDKMHAFHEHFVRIRVRVGSVCTSKAAASALYLPLHIEDAVDRIQWGCVLDFCGGGLTNTSGWTKQLTHTERVFWWKWWVGCETFVWGWWWGKCLAGWVCIVRYSLWFVVCW